MIGKRDDGLDYLLGLDGWIVVFDDLSWTKCEVRKVDPSPARPHGIRYNLTYHDKNNVRLMGFDNAHAVLVPKMGKYSGKVFAYDHRHKSAADEGTSYAFSSPYQLVADFFAEVDRIREKLAK